MVNVSELKRNNYLFQKSRGIAIQIDNPNGLHLIKAWGVDYPIEDFEPILITADFLKNRGYYKIKGANCWACDDPPLDVIFRKDGSVKYIRIAGHVFDPFIKIEYVHHLQNLYFDLTGKELILNTPELT